MAHATYQRDRFERGTFPHTYTAEAAELGIDPNGWPVTITVPGLGNGRDFHAYERITLNREFFGWRYRQDMGCVELNIYND